MLKATHTSDTCPFAEASIMELSELDLETIAGSGGAAYYLQSMRKALAAAGRTTRNGSPFSASTAALQLQMLGSAAK